MVSQMCCVRPMNVVAWPRGEARQLVARPPVWGRRSELRASGEDTDCCRGDPTARPSGRPTAGLPAAVESDADRLQRGAEAVEVVDGETNVATPASLSCLP
jgi:hypothetical protein